jgi:hypothetical protein
MSAQPAQQQSSGVAAFRSNFYTPQPDPMVSPSPQRDEIPTRRSNVGFGVASLVLSLVFLCGLGSLLGIIFGVLGIRKANADGTSEGKGLSIAGIAVGALGLLVVAWLGLTTFGVVNEQRSAGYDSAVTSDLRNASTAQETYFTENGVYSTSVSDLYSMGFSESSSENYAAGGNLAVVTAGIDGYCMQATSAAGTVISYDSQQGSNRGPCPG